jgi:hypothetical protein
MKVYLPLTLALLMLLPPAHGQQGENKKRLGASKAGLFLGSAGELAHWTAQPHSPLRIGLVDPYFTDDSSPAWAETFIPSLLSTAQTAWAPHYISRLTALPLKSSEEDGIPTPPQPYHQKAYQELTDTGAVDLIVSSHFYPVGKRYWGVLKISHGGDGRTLKLVKIEILPPFDSQKIATQLINAFDFIPLAATVGGIYDGPEANTGSELHLRTTPPDLDLYLNGDPVGKTPLILRHLKAQAYDLEMSEVRPYQITRLRLNSEPPDLPVHLNQRLIGKTPLNLPKELLTPGDYTLELETNQPFVASLEVQTAPDGVAVEIQGVGMRRTPVTFEQLRSKKIQLKLTPLRPVKVHQKLVLETNQQQNLHIDLYKMSKLIVESPELGAQIWLDGEQVGETPFSQTLPQGFHQLELRKNRFKTYRSMLTLDPGELQEYFVVLEPKNVDSSIFLIPTGESSSGLQVSSRYLGFSSFTNTTTDQSGPAHFLSTEVTYGWPSLSRWNFFDFGLSAGAFLGGLNTPEGWRSLQGIGGKLQILRESNSIPVSMALASYINIDLAQPKLVGAISLSRNFFDFALHLGLQTHGTSVGIGYTGIDRFSLGLSIFSDGFFKLFTNPGQEMGTFYGIQAGYSF